MEERVGISGWRYKPWKGEFYPRGLTEKNQLAFVSKNLNSVEVNGTFYRLQNLKNFISWREQTEEDFIFSIKGSRYITHTKRLKNVEEALRRFFASGVLELGPKLGPFLWQFPPSMKWNQQRFKNFFKALPKNPRQACLLADHGLSPENLKRMRIRHAIEIRNPTFDNDQFFELLKENRFSLVMSDGGEKWPYFERITSDFVYVRLHGKQQLYTSGYSYQALTSWKKKIRKWEKEGKDVYVYFDNDAKVHAPFNAMYLASKLKEEIPPDFTREQILRHENPHKAA